MAARQVPVCLEHTAGTQKLANAAGYPAGRIAVGISIPQQTRIHAHRQMAIAPQSEIDVQFPTGIRRQRQVAGLVELGVANVEGAVLLVIVGAVSYTNLTLPTNR